MAGVHNRKRACADDILQEHHPNKKIKKIKSDFPPKFWDNLSKVWLTRSALRELDQRNKAQPARGLAAHAVSTTDLAQFARYGGPDLRHLRGCPQPKLAIHAMASSRSARSSRRIKPTESTTTTTATPGRSSAYHKNFEQNLCENNVYLHGRKSKPNNKADLHRPRRSLSPSKFSDGAFERFQEDHDYIGSEGDVMRKLVPVISGSANIPNSGDVLFNNLESITNGATIAAKPDFYDGARFDDIDTVVIHDLNGLIIPSDTNITRCLVAPNFFLEAEAPWGDFEVTKRQAGLDGAIGARAMHALQNYGAEEPTFDGNAYTYSSTYHAGAGTLQLYAHHVTPPAVPGGRPEYHMAQVDGWSLTGNIDTFRRGATAFRNARDLAQRHRGSFIQAANERSRQPGMEAPPGAEIAVAVVEQYEESIDEFVDCEDDPGSQAVGTGDADGEPTLSRYPREDEEPSRETTPLGAEPAMSFATSVTPSFDHNQTSSKRARLSDSSPSNPQPYKKRFGLGDRKERVSTSGGFLRTGLDVFRICCATAGLGVRSVMDRFVYTEFDRGLSIV